MKQVIVMRGIPGAGKDWWAQQLMANKPPAEVHYMEVFSADAYFQNGSRYEFKPELLANAHSWCFSRFMREVGYAGLAANRTLIVNNTNIHAWECAPYMMAAQAYGWDCKIVTVFCPPRIAYERGVHGVPYGTVARMEGALYAEHDKGNFPKHWKMEEVQNG